MTSDPQNDAEHWRQLEELFHVALEQPPEERQAFLDQTCDDPELRHEILELIAAEGQADECLSGTVDDALDEAFAPEADDLDGATPRRIGPYRLLERLGEGGLATVYLAERDDQYHIRVAIKMVKRGMDTREILRRLRLERQILAGLDHPNVARLLDGGSTESGQPYVVMEYIDGEPIDQHCDARGLGLRERLEIFAKVGSAVHAAHRNLVIHRDLKPSNVLVTADGEPKLLDFGIAKLLDPTRVHHTEVHTVTGMRWLTPEYASPEQVRGEPLTTAADVYALGVLLYELLCGRRPFDFPTHRPGEIERLVSETEPPKLSARRHDLPERLRRRLRGDLDRITAVALHKDPERRYPSAQALTDDIERHLTSRPIVARADSALYRLGKFVRRHRAGVAVAAMVAASLIAGIVSTTRARWVADAERQRAERHLAEVEEVVRFNVRMFEIADPGEARGNTITVREVLDRAAERVDVELGERPAVAARLLSTLGLVHQALGLAERASELLESALARRRAAFGDDSPEVAQGLHELAGARRDQSRLDDAKELFRQAIEHRQRLFGERHVDTAASLHGLGTVHVAAGEWADAERLYRRSLELRQELHGETRADTAESLNDLAEVLFYQRDLAAAEELFGQALRIRRRLLGDDHPLVAETLHNLAAVATLEGRPAEAEARYKEVLELRRRLFDGPHRDVVRTLYNVAVALDHQGRGEPAEVALRDALEMAEALDDPLEIGRGLRALSRLLADHGRAAEAEPLARRGLELELATLGELHPSVARSRYALARVLAGLERPREAIDVLEAQLRDQRRIPDMPPSSRIPALTLLAEQHALLGACAPAGTSLDEARELDPEFAGNATLAARVAAVNRLCDAS